MDIITIDFETYYDKDISLKKLTTEEYIRHPEFEVIGVSVKVNDEETQWLSGEFSDLQKHMQTAYKWHDSAVLAHNCMFDGAILHWLFGISPRVWFDTLSMSRAIHGVEVSASLKNLAELYSIGEKGDEILNAAGKHRCDFTSEELSRYGDYCVNDTELTYQLFSLFLPHIPKTELKIIDMTLRMFTHPILELDAAKLTKHLDTIQKDKEEILADTHKLGITKDDLMSNPKFAKALEHFGVKAPTKTSLRTGEETFAFAKTDEGFLALQAHEDIQVQTLVAARIGLKSTLEETRTQKFLAIAGRGTLPVPIKYYAAHTGRWGGYDKINLQNLPSRGQNAKVLKSCITAPHGYTLIESDSAQIEARVLAWLSGQDDLVESFRKGEDVYKKMASVIYGKPVEDISSAQRFIGKTTILGAGYSMGWRKFQNQLKNFGVEVEAQEARRIIQVYRQANANITGLWKEAQAALIGMYKNNAYVIGRNGVLSVVPEQNAIRLPSGLLMRYDKLKVEQDENGMQLVYRTRRGWTKIYGGKAIENVCQGIARCIMAEQMLMIARRYKVLLTVHDSVVCCVPDKEVDTAAYFVEECMQWVPVWAEGLPLTGDVQIGKNYGDCKEWKNPHGLLAV